MVDNTGTLGWSRCIESMRVASKQEEVMVGYFKNAPREDEVLLTEKEMLDKGVNFSETLQVALSVALKAQHNKTLTKAREAVGGVRSPYFHTTHMNQTYPCKACVFDEAIQAILKALGGE